MNNLNSVILEGNLVRDCEVKTVGQGSEVCSFTIAVNRYYRKENFPQKETGFFPVEAWGRLAQKTASSAVKGQLVRVLGRLKQEKWSDREGRAQSKVVIVAESVECTRAQKKEAASKEDYGFEENGNETFTVPF